MKNKRILATLIAIVLVATGGFMTAEASSSYWADVDNYGKSGAHAARSWRNAVAKYTAACEDGTASENHYIATGRKILVPADVLSAIKEKDCTFVMNTGYGVDFSITGANVPADAAAIDLCLNTGVSGPAYLVAEEIKDALWFRHYPMENQNEFGMPVGFHINVKGFAGKYANLCQYVGGEFVCLSSSEINEFNQAMFYINGGGNYLVTITEEPKK